MSLLTQNELAMFPMELCCSIKANIDVTDLRSLLEARQFTDLYTRVSTA